MLLVRFENQSAFDAYVINQVHQAVAAFIKEIGKLDSIGVDIKI